MLKAKLHRSCFCFYIKLFFITLGKLIFSDFLGEYIIQYCCQRTFFKELLSNSFFFLQTTIQENQCKKFVYDVWFFFNEHLIFNLHETFICNCRNAKRSENTKKDKIFTYTYKR